MVASVRVIETLASAAPLGIRFWDTATQGFVHGGLNVTAYPPSRPDRTTQALVNTSGVYVFPHLPGLRELENGAGDAQYWASLPPGRPFTVEVNDREGRFLACRFQVNAPVRGLLGLACLSPLGPGLESPLSTAAAVPLFSSPARVTPASMGVIRGQLWDAAANLPASWAFVIVQPPDAPSVLGLADAQGQATMFLPYPEPAGRGVGSPLGAPAAPLWAQQWMLPLSVYYDPPAGGPATPVAAGRIPPPDLCDVLRQRPAALWLTRSPLVQLAEVELRFGEEAILRSQGGGGEKLSVVFVGD